MPVPRCAECVVKESLGGSWRVETLTPKFAKKPKTEVHLVRETKQFKRVSCYTIYEAQTACGVTFQYSLDSSD